MKKITLALALAGAVGMVAACGGGSGEESGNTPEETGSNAVTAPIENAESAVADLEKAAEGGMSAEMHTLSFTFDGMSLGMSCAPRVEGILKEIPGVESAKVDYDSKTATIECSSAVTAEAITDVVAKSGQYSVEVQN